MLPTVWYTINVQAAENHSLFIICMIEQADFTQVALSYKSYHRQCMSNCSHVYTKRQHSCISNSLCSHAWVNLQYSVTHGLVSITVTSNFKHERRNPHRFDLHWDSGCPLNTEAQECLTHIILGQATTYLYLTREVRSYEAETTIFTKVPCHYLMCQVSFTPLAV